MDIKLIPGYDHKETIRELFSEYTDMLIAGDSRFEKYLGMQNFDEELRNLEHKYGEPEGRLYIALVGGRVAGCIGLRKIDDSRCEMKRLYVRPEFRGAHLGEFLAKKIIDDARAIGYKELLLDTLPFLQSAIHLYEKLGFVLIDKYNDSPMDTSIFMKLTL